MGAACVILFASNKRHFRTTRNLDVVLTVEALTSEFGKYKDKPSSMGKPLHIEVKLIHSDILEYKMSEKYDGISQVVLRHVTHGELFLRKMLGFLKDDLI